MQIIKLPSIFPGDLDLAQINQQLRDRAAQLDWSAVVSADAKYLAVLLARLDISDDEEVLGSDTLSDTIGDRVIQVLEQAETQPSKMPQKKPKPSSVTPQVWKQDNLTSDRSDIDIPEPLTEEGTSIAPLLEKPSAYEMRDRLEEMIFKDLLGPAGGEEEEIDENNVSDRYLVGLLAPLIRNKKPEEPTEDQPELQDELATTDKGNPEEGSTEGTTPPSTTMFPSSIGMTFCVDGDAKEIEITAKWGKYEREKSEYNINEKGDTKTVWKRHPIAGVKIQSLETKREFQWIVNTEEAPSVYVKGKIRRMDNQDWIVTLFLVNAQTEPSRSRDRAWLFQPELSVRSADANNAEIFVRKPLPASQNIDPAIHLENQQMAMLYRHHIEFAVGHGVSICAKKINPKSPRAIELKTSVLPSYEVPQTTPPTVEELPELAGLVLDMKILAQSSPEELTLFLTPLTIAYENWIDKQQQQLNNNLEELSAYQQAAETAISNCKQALERIEAGINTLQTNPQAVEAFQFMNRAMWQQRIHSIHAEAKRRGEEVDFSEIDLPKNRSWRTFQLAFILLNLPSLTDLHHRDRTHPNDAICDLLWFPTGGGKTEAYLGLTAYAIALRRLQGKIGNRDGEKGIAVLMRYTLRLLTLQQFQRATTLICACESIRRENPQKWGAEPIRIGLWVGQNSTPNYTSGSEEFIKQQKGGTGGLSGSGSPHQLTNCPWCGTKIHVGKHIIVDPVDKGQGRTLIYCGDALGNCLFSQKQSPNEGLPVLVVDEEIYRRLPALLIATVDKFAQMPWKGEIQMLFGQVNGYCDRHGFRSPDIEDTDSHKKTNRLPAAKTHSHLKLRPPDLIIQDELHLISGPLGTLVGLYETAVDELSSWDVDGQKVRPKVIASTATTRQVATQVYYLFLRKVQVFPPQGLDIEDNFFSRQRKPSPLNPGRRYLGICAPGRRLKAAIIRVYLAVLAASQALYEKYGKEADPWMTLVGYFNSLRELGGTRRLVEDDIATRLKRMSDRGLANRMLRSLEELTSRKDSTEIPLILDRLEIPFDPDREAENKAKRKAGQKIERPDPLDVILATNMISVGVDVKRLGAMVVCGQSKNTAEYIQATSRVGRTYPGLVITVYNWARPRDLSHYERFAHYHATFYQNVESLSVTPFAPGALYRGLTALFVSLVRLLGEEFNSNDRAGTIERNHPYLQAAIEAIVQRAAAIEDAKTGDRLRQELEAKLDNWLAKAQNRYGGGTLKYQTSSRDGTAINLLHNAGKGEWNEFTCLNSLRNVEPTIGLILTEQFSDDEGDRVYQPFVSREAVQ
jgi:hypothetical protein